MDPKTLLILWAVFVGLGWVVKNLLKIFGLTRVVVVEGGKTTRAVALLACVVSGVGWFLFLIAVAFYWDTVLEISGYVF